jgi:hypothetical protein
MPYETVTPELAEIFWKTRVREDWQPYMLRYPLTPEMRSRLPATLPVECPRQGPTHDIFNLGHGGRPNDFVVNDRVRRLIEGLEPGVHTFIPVTLQDVKNDRLLEGYFFLYVGQAIDAVIISRTEFMGGFGEEGFRKEPLLQGLSHTIVLDSAKIAGKHLWAGGQARLGGGGDPHACHLFCSDALAKTFKAEKVKGWVFDKHCKAEPA